MNEQISALIDDEIAVEDAMHIITSMQSQKQAAEAWQHYHLIGDVMRGNAILSKDFKQNLMKKIDAEATVLSPAAHKTNAQPSIRVKAKLPATWSIAASVAAVAVVGLMAINTNMQGNDVAPIEIAQSIPAEYLQAHQASAPSSGSYYVQPEYVQPVSFSK